MQKPESAAGSSGWQNIGSGRTAGRLPLAAWLASTTLPAVVSAFCISWSSAGVRGSERKTSTPSTRGLPAAMRRMAVAMSVRGIGYWRICAKLASSKSTKRIFGAGGLRPAWSTVKS
jgi:hypothetical protein